MLNRHPELGTTLLVHANYFCIQYWCNLKLRCTTNIYCSHVLYDVYIKIYTIQRLDISIICNVYIKQTTKHS